MKKTVNNKTMFSIYSLANVIKNLVLINENCIKFHQYNMNLVFASTAALCQVNQAHIP